MKRTMKILMMIKFDESFLKAMWGIVPENFLKL